MTVPVPRQEVVEAADRMVGDACEDVSEPSLRTDVVALRCLDEGVDDAGTLTVAIGAAEQPSLPAERYQERSDAPRHQWNIVPSSSRFTGR